MLKLSELLHRLGDQRISATIELRATLVLSQSPLAERILTGVTARQAGAWIEGLGLQHQEARLNSATVEGKNSLSGAFIPLFSLDLDEGEWHQYHDSQCGCGGQNEAEHRLREAENRAWWASDLTLREEERAAKELAGQRKMTRTGGCKVTVRRIGNPAQAVVDRVMSAPTPKRVIEDW